MTKKIATTARAAEVTKGIRTAAKEIVKHRDALVEWVQAADAEQVWKTEGHESFPVYLKKTLSNMGAGFKAADRDWIICALDDMGLPVRTVAAIVDTSPATTARVAKKGREAKAAKGEKVAPKKTRSADGVTRTQTAKKSQAAKGNGRKAAKPALSKPSDIARKALQDALAALEKGSNADALAKVEQAAEHLRATVADDAAKAA